MRKSTKNALYAVLFLFVLVVCLIISADWEGLEETRREAELKGRTNTRVEATIGVPSENKLGGIRFIVSDGRWEEEGYSLVVFYVEGFNAGLTLDKVCLILPNENMKEITRLSVEWDKWLGRYREILAETTIGKKDTTLLDLNLIPVK